jgi:hypothetical protein
MLDPEVFLKASLQFVHYFLELGWVLVSQYHMSAQNGMVRTEIPDVKIVDLGHAWRAAHVFLDIL